MREFGSIIGGRQVMGPDWIEVHNPYSGKLVGRVSAVNREHAIDAVQRVTGSQSLSHPL